MAISSISNSWSTTVMEYAGITENDSITEIIKNIFYEYILETIETKRSYLSYSMHISDVEFDRRVLTRHMTPRQRLVLSLFSQRYQPEIINDFTQILLSEDGIARLAENHEFYKEYPKFALIALIKRGDVTEGQVTSICLLYQAMNQLIYERSHVEIYKNKKKHLAWSITKLENNPGGYIPEMDTRSILKIRSEIKEFFQLDIEEFNAMRKAFANPAIPRSETYYHRIQLPLGPNHSWSPIYHRILQIMPHLFWHSIQVNYSITFGEPTKAMIIPSFTMIKIFLNLKLKSHSPMKITPLLGECSRKIIAYYKFYHDTCIVQVGMNGADTPFEADRFYAGTLGFSMHDVYHAIRNSLIKPEHRRAISFIVDHVLKHITTKSAEGIKEKLIDGELISDQEQFGRIFKKSRILWDSECRKAVILSMVRLKEYWGTEFKLTQFDLLGHEQELYLKYTELMTPYEEQRAEQELSVYLLEVEKRKKEYSI